MIELVVSMAVLGIFFATFATVIGSSISHSSTIQEQSVLQTEVRAAADTLVADLRQASIAGDSSLSRISTATATQSTFLSPDRLVTDAPTAHLLSGVGYEPPASDRDEHEYGGAVVDPGARCVVDCRALDRDDGESGVHVLRREQCRYDHRGERQLRSDPNLGRPRLELERTAELRHTGRTEVCLVKWLMQRLRAEDGVALVLVVFGVALVATLSVVLIDVVTSESARSAKAVTKQSAFEAAEAAIDDYIAKLADDRNYYLHWVHPAESSRKDDGTGGTANIVSTSGSSPASSSWCRDPATKPAPKAWTLGATWINGINGKDHWCSLGNGYEYNLQITPPSASVTGVTILATGRKIGNASDTRVIQAVATQSSVTDFQQISNGNIGVGSGATLYGRVYANGNISWSGGTALSDNYATGSITGSVTWGSGATGYDGSTSTSYTDLFTPPSPLKGPIDFNNFLTSFSDIASAAADTTGGGIYLDSSYSTWRLIFNAAGTITIQGCNVANIERSTSSPSCATVSTVAVPSNGAIYSEVSIIVQGTVKGRVTAATPARIIVGGNLLYQGDASFSSPAYGQNVLGLEAMGAIVVPCWMDRRLRRR